MNILLQFLEILAEHAWLGWPIAMLADVVLSSGYVNDYRLYRTRWAFRVLHSVTLAAVVMVFGVEFFWLDIIDIHYHGGWEILVVGPLVLYVSIRLAQRLDAQSPHHGKAGTQSALGLWIPAVNAVLLALAIVSSITRAIPLLADREIGFIFVVVVLSLIAAGSLRRCSIRTAHVVLTLSLATACLLLTAGFFIAADFEFFGFLPWGHANDDPWFYVLTGLVCFPILAVITILRSRQEMKNTEASDANSHT